jgi:hypothetical protein
MCDRKQTTEARPCKGQISFKHQYTKGRTALDPMGGNLSARPNVPAATAKPSTSKPM